LHRQRLPHLSYTQDSQRRPLPLLLVHLTQPPEAGALQIAIFMVVLPFWSSCNLTDGSDLRGKAEPNWVRKILNCFRFL
jgi:hypothetical protein